MTVASLHVSHGLPVGEAVTTDGLHVLNGDALRAIVAERMKQVHRHGRTLASDQHTNRAEDLPLASASYVLAAIDQLTGTTPAGRDVSKPDPSSWPWGEHYWKPEDPRANLVKAAALLWAAIDWLDNAPGDGGDAVAMPVPGTSAANDAGAEDAA